jgi:PKD repeat protein
MVRSYRSWSIAPLCIAAAAALLSKPAGAERGPYPARSGTTREWIEQARRELERLPPARPPLAVASGDRDVHGIALIEDDGTLLRVLTPQLLVTSTLPIVQRFYASHGDDYDYVCVFVSTAFEGDPTPEAGFAFESNVMNNVSGIGLPPFDLGLRVAPHVSRLRSIINMNDLGEYCHDPSESIPAFLGSWSGLDVMGQEMLHSFGAFVNADNIEILGRGSAHWSFFFHSYGSVLEGNGWRANADGSFTSVDTGSGLSQLDQYLLGLLRPEEVVDPMYAIQSPQPSLASSGGRGALPVAGITVTGTAVPVTMDNILNIHGPRNPDASVAPKEFNVAYLLLVPFGLDPPLHDLEKLDELRTQWEALFAAETGGRGRMTSDLGGPMPVSAAFESNVFAGTPGLTVKFDNDAFGRNTGFLWDFGDGATSSDRHPLHTYTRPGSFDVTLTVSGEDGPAVATRPGYVRVGSVITWFEDDFETSLGWTRDPASTATWGNWIRADPFATALRAQYGTTEVAAIVQPEDDHSPGGRLCWMTGPGFPQADVDFDDVDGGITVLVSPRIDLTDAVDPMLGFWFWFVNNGGGEPGRDPFLVEVSNNDGATWHTARIYHSSHFYWREEHLRLRDWIEPTANVRVRFRAQDEGWTSIVEALVDDVRIFEVDVTTAVQVSDLSAASAPEGVVLRWTLSADAVREATGVRVERAVDAAGPYATVAASLPPAVEMVHVDRDVVPGDTRWYRVALETPSGVQVSVPVQVTYARTVSTRFDTPFVQRDGSVALRFALAERARVRFGVYDVTGKRVAVFGASERPAGEHGLVWEPIDGNGQALARGVYVVRLEAGRQTMSRKIALTR